MHNPSSEARWIEARHKCTPNIIAMTTSVLHTPSKKTESLSPIQIFNAACSTCDPAQYSECISQLKSIAKQGVSSGDPSSLQAILRLTDLALLPREPAQKLEALEAIAQLSLASSRDATVHLKTLLQDNLPSNPLTATPITTLRTHFWQAAVDTPHAVRSALIVQAQDSKLGAEVAKHLVETIAQIGEASEQAMLLGAIARAFRAHDQTSIALAAVERLGTMASNLYDLKQAKIGLAELLKTQGSLACHPEICEIARKLAASQMNREHAQKLLASTDISIDLVDHIVDLTKRHRWPVTALATIVLRTDENNRGTRYYAADHLHQLCSMERGSGYSLAPDTILELAKHPDLPGSLLYQLVVSAQNVPANRAVNVIGCARTVIGDASKTNNGRHVMRDEAMAGAIVVLGSLLKDRQVEMSKQLRGEIVAELRSIKQLAPHPYSMLAADALRGRLVCAVSSLLARLTSLFTLRNSDES